MQADACIVSYNRQGSLPLRQVACTMPKITRISSRSSKGGRRSRRKSGAAESSAPGAVQQDASSHSHHPEAVAGETSPQTSVASLSLEQLTDAVGARVIQESRSQVTTPYLSRDDGGAGTMSSFYQAEADVPPVELAPRQAQRCQFPPPMVVSAAHVCSWEVGFVLS